MSTEETELDPSAVAEPALTGNEKALLASLIAEENGELLKAIKRGDEPAQVDALFDLIGAALALLGAEPPPVVSAAYDRFAAARAAKGHPPAHWGQVLAAFSRYYGSESLRGERTAQARTVVARRYP